MEDVTVVKIKFKGIEREELMQVMNYYAPKLYTPDQTYSMPAIIRYLITEEAKRLKKNTA